MKWIDFTKENFKSSTTESCGLDNRSLKTREQAIRLRVNVLILLFFSVCCWCCRCCFYTFIFIPNNYHVRSLPFRFPISINQIVLFGSLFFHSFKCFNVTQYKYCSLLKIVRLHANWKTMNCWWLSMEGHTFVCLLNGIQCFLILKYKSCCCSIWIFKFIFRSSSAIIML